MRSCWLHDPQGYSCSKDFPWDLFIMSHELLKVKRCEVVTTSTSESIPMSVSQASPKLLGCLSCLSLQIVWDYICMPPIMAS